MPHVTFIHGIANKPAADVLLRLWRDALANDDGLDLGAEGITSSMVYWADVLYEEPDVERAEHESNDSIIAASDPDIDMSWCDDVGADERQWIDQMTARMKLPDEPADGEDTVPPPYSEGELEASLERVPLPWWLKRRLMRRWLRDVHHYLFNTKHRARPDGPEVFVQDEIRARMIQALEEGANKPGPHIIVSHSMGTVVSYDCLQRVAECPAVDGLMTVGSPLGLDEVQDKLRPEYSREDGFPVSKLSGRWVNVFDRLDPVAGFDPEIANDYKLNGDATVEDIHEPNWGAWRHNLSNYFAGQRLRQTMAEMLKIL